MNNIRFQAILNGNVCCGMEVNESEWQAWCLKHLMLSNSATSFSSEPSDRLLPALPMLSRVRRSAGQSVQLQLSNLFAIIERFGRSFIAAIDWLTTQRRLPLLSGRVACSEQSAVNVGFDALLAKRLFCKHTVWPVIEQLGDKSNNFLGTSSSASKCWSAMISFGVA